MNTREMRCLGSAKVKLTYSLMLYPSTLKVNVFLRFSLLVSNTKIAGLSLGDLSPGLAATATNLFLFMY